MTVVKSQPGMSTDQLLRQFNKKVQADGVLLKLREREFYEKPSQRRQRKKKEAARKMRSSARRSE